MAERPNPPSVGTDEYERWKRSATINYEGGYLEAAYGNLVQTFADFSTAGVIGTRQVSVKEQQRVNTIGGASKTILPFTYTSKVIPRRNSSGAAGGLPITIVTPVGSYTARLGGNIEDLVTFLSDATKIEVIDSMSFASTRGAVYGPFLAPTPAVA